MHIKTIPEESIFTAPITFEDTPLIRTSLCLQGVRIMNEEPGKIHITSIAFQLQIKNKTVWQLVYNGEFLEQTVNEFAGYAPQRFQDPNITRILLGRSTFWDFDLLQSQPTLVQNQEIGFELATIEYRSEKVPELLQINVKYQEWENETSNPSNKEMSKKFPIVTTGSKNTYLLPLKGGWHYNRSYDWDFGHRHSYSQEFAMDFQQYTAQKRIKKGQRLPNSDFPHYGALIYAVGEGTVTIVGDNFPENELSDEIIMIDPEQQKKFIAQLGFNRTLMGNHVMIAHPNGEYSLYCHMIPGKMCVKEGETVIAGQQIGQLGNSGFSGFPHLHFQIIDGSDPLKSRGVPCRFSNITDEYAQKIIYLQTNNQYIHTDDPNNKYQ